MTAGCSREKITIHKCFQWQEVLKNKSHFVLLQMWHLIAVKTGENSEVRPLLVRVSHDTRLIMLLFLEAEEMQGLGPRFQVETTSS